MYRATKILGTGSTSLHAHVYIDSSREGERINNCTHKSEANLYNFMNSFSSFLRNSNYSQMELLPLREVFPRCKEKRRAK